LSSFDNQKQLKFIITLGNGSFGGGAGNQITLEGFRASVSIDKAGGMIGGTLRAQIWGVNQSNMNACVAYPNQPSKFASGQAIFNTIQVFAIDGNQETLIFTGNIVIAWGNYQNMPDVFLEIQAQSTYAGLMSSAIPRSYKGQIDVATAMGQIANQLGLTFENNGVTTQLSNQYLPGTALQQARALADAAGCWLYIDNGVLAIVQAYMPRNTNSVPIISPQTGLKGYPTFDSTGVHFDCLFNPAIVWGGGIQLQTSIPQAAGTWIVACVGLKLESQKYNGAWFMTIVANASGLVVRS